MFPYALTAEATALREGPGGPAGNTRVEIHLPGFGGAYNSFGASSPSSTDDDAAALEGPFLPIQNGIRPYSRRYGLKKEDADATPEGVTAANSLNEAVIDQCIAAAEWDPKREVLKITAESGDTPATVCDLDYFNGVTIDEGYLRQLFDRHGLPSGKGPLPPLGGIDETWFKKAWVRTYPAASCSGAGPNRAGLGSETCDPDATGVVFSTFSRDVSANMQFETTNDWVPTQHVGPVGTSAKPGFAWLAAAGDATGKGATTCITVTMIPSVAMTSPSGASMTDITISGLTGSDTADTSSLAIFAGGSCSKSPSLSDVHDNSNSIRAAVNRAGAAVGQVAAGGIGGTNGGIALTDQIVSPGGKPWQGRWDKADGTLEIRIGAGFSIEAGEVVTFSFQLENSQTAQASREIFAAAKGFYCTSNLCTTATDATLSVDPTKFSSISSVLDIREPAFEVARIHQSTSTPGATATITVSLQPNTAIAGTGAEVTLSGLCGTVRNADKKILDMFGSPIAAVSSPSTANIEGTADWDLDSKVFKFNLGTAGLDAGTLYVFKFTWELIDSENAACPVTITATGNDKSFAATTMNGSVGKVDAPAFTTAKIGQTSTRPDALNFICITLETNKNFNSQSDGQQEQSTFTLSGLTGSQLEDERGVRLYPCPSNSLQAGANEYGFNTKNGWAMPYTPQTYTPLTGPAVPFLPRVGEQGRFDFTAATGTAEFVMDPSGFVSGSEYVFAILMENSETASDCKTVTLTASGDITQTITMSQSSYARALVDGEADGDACALKVYDLGFLVKIASSNRKLVDASAVVTVTLRSNLDILSSTNNGFKSSITISGLTGSKSSGTTTLADVLVGGNGNVATAFTPAFDEVSWTQNTGVLVLKLAEGSGCQHPSGSSAKSVPQTCIKAGVEYVFQFLLQNGATPQEAPVMTLATNYETGKVLTQTMELPAGGSGCTRDQPLRILAEDRLLCKYNIGQLTAAPSARNSLCVTLATNKDLATTVSGDASRFVAFTITGLTGFQTDGQELTIRDISTGELLVGDQTAGATNKENTDRFGNVNIVHNMFCSTSDNGVSGCATNQNNLVTFTEATGEASFFLAMSNSMTAGTDYEFCFQVTNPSTTAPCKTDISIKVKDSDMATSAAVPFAMTIDSGDACVGYTTDRMFTTANIRSHSNVTSMVAGIFLELSPNHVISAGTVVTVAGLNGYMGSSQSSTGTATDVDIEVVKNGVRNTAVFGRLANWDGTSQLKLTVQTGQSVAARNHLANANMVTFDGTPEEDDIYEIYFELKNSASEQSARPLTVTATNFKADGLIESGLTSSRRSLEVARARRAGHGGKGDLVFKFTPKKAIAGGQSIILELPWYTMAIEGPVFGITSSNKAFTTYTDRSDWELQGVSSSKARALFTNGFVASGTSASRKSQKTSGLDGFFMLATKDDSTPNKNNWFTEATLWEGTLKYENVDGDGVVGDGEEDSETSNYNEGVAGLYGISSTSVLRAPIDQDDLIGMRLSCTRRSTTTFSPDIFPSSHYVTESAYILENAAGGAKIIVENLFSAAVFGSHNTDNTILDAQCRIEYKPTVARYTGMTVMFDNGKEFTIKQGAGALYQLSDGSGVPPSAYDIEGRAYTIYSQLEITAAVGESVAAGETVTITLPGTAGIKAPSDLSAPTVWMQGDSKKCRTRVVPSPSLDKADTNNVMTSCGYAGMPVGDMSIAAKSTIRRVFASALGVSSANAAISTATLSTIAPYQYSSDVGPLLMSKPMDVYGSLSLLSTAVASADEGNAGLLSISAGMDGSRTSWTREQNFAGGAIVFGQEAYGMTAPLDVNALQRVIAVADASNIDVGDYLAIGNEMMYVESIDGNYIGVQRGVAGTLATSHRAMNGLDETTTGDPDVDKVYSDDQPFAGDDAKTAAANGNIAGAADAAGAGLSVDYDGIPAHGIITIWKRDTTVNSYFLTEDHDAEATAPVIGADNGADLDISGDSGFILLVGGTEFMLATALADADAGTLTVAGAQALPAQGDRITAATAVATAALPFVARNSFAHSMGESVVQYTCGWDADADNEDDDGYRTIGGINTRTNLCKTTSLVGLPVLPLASTTGIKPGDFLRIDFPKLGTGAGQAEGLVDNADEEIYLVNAVNENDVVVTAKPLADDENHAANVNRYPGGTAIDLLSATGISITYTATATIAADDDFTFTATSSLDDVAVGQYCLIDSEFMMINSIVGTTVGFVEQTDHAADTRGNRGRGAFGTDPSDTHARAGSCALFTYSGGGGQGSGKPYGNTGFTSIYDPRVTVRQVASVSGAGHITLTTGAQELQKKVSEPAQMIGDPAEQHGNPYPVRAGSDFACATGLADTYIVATNDGAAAELAAQTNPAYSATSTVFTVDDVTNIMVGDYIGTGAAAAAVKDVSLVTAVDYADNTFTAVRSTAERPAHPTPQCLKEAMDPQTPVAADVLFYVLHKCPVLGSWEAPARRRSSMNLRATTLDVAASATDTTIVLDAAADLAVGNYYKANNEIILVTRIYENDDNDNVMDVIRDVKIPCRQRSDIPTAGALPAGFEAFIPLIFPVSPSGRLADTVDDVGGAVAINTDYYNTFGEDFQIDANVVKAGTVYVAGALGDVLEDVNRDNELLADEVYNSNPIVNIEGSPGPTKFFASPWGAGGNVTEFCYETRTGTAAKTTTIATAITDDETTTVVVAPGGLTKLGVVLGDYIQVNLEEDADTADAGTAISVDGADPKRPQVRTDGNVRSARLRANLPLATTGEYMRVTAIDYSASSMTVIRNVVPNCLPANLDRPLETLVAGSVVNLVTPVYDTVQLRDSVTKSAGRAEGGTWTEDASGAVRNVGTLQGAKDSGRCAMTSEVDTGYDVAVAMVTDPTALDYNTLVLEGATQTTDGTYNTPLRAGDYIRIADEYMLITHINTGDEDGDTVPEDPSTFKKLTLTVARAVTPPCLEYGPPVAHNGVAVELVLSDGCYRDVIGALDNQDNEDFALDLGDEALAPDDTTITLSATTSIEVGGFLKIGPIATATEYVLVTDVDVTNNIVTVVRNTAPRCLKSIATTITIPAEEEDAIMVLGNPTDVELTKPGRSNSMISTSMRAIIELSPREHIEWIVPEDLKTRLVRDIIHQGLTLEDFASPSRGVRRLGSTRRC